MTHILIKAGVMLSKQQIAEIVKVVDLDQNGEVDVRELDEAVKNARKKHRGAGTDAVTRLKKLPPGVGGGWGGGVCLASSRGAVEVPPPPSPPLLPRGHPPLLPPQTVLSKVSATPSGTRTSVVPRKIMPR